MTTTVPHPADPVEESLVPRYEDALGELERLVAAMENPSRYKNEKRREL